MHILIVASNHFQAIASAPDAKAKARFMGHINSNIAKEAGRLYKWKDKFWSKRYTAIAIEDDESLVAKFKYILAQDPHDSPRHSKKSPKPWCHAKDKKNRQAFKQAYKSFEAAYRLAADRLRQGRSAKFPEGCFPPAPAFAARELEIAFAPG